jgi:hypothetical protein
VPHLKGTDVWLVDALARGQRSRPPRVLQAREARAGPFVPEQVAQQPRRRRGPQVPLPRRFPDEREPAELPQRRKRDEQRQPRRLHPRGFRPAAAGASGRPARRGKGSGRRFCRAGLVVVVAVGAGWALAAAAGGRGVRGGDGPKARLDPGLLRV